MKFKSYIMISSHIMITLECNKMNTGAVHVNTLQVFGSFVGFFFFFWLNMTVCIWMAWVLFF